MCYCLPLSLGPQSPQMSAESSRCRGGTELGEDVPAGGFTPPLRWTDGVSALVGPVPAEPERPLYQVFSHKSEILTQFL